MQTKQKIRKLSTIKPERTRRLNSLYVIGGITFAVLLFELSYSLIQVPSIHAQLLDCMRFNGTKGHLDTGLDGCIEGELSFDNRLAVDYNNEGIELIKNNNPKEAIEQFNLALELEPNMTTALGNKAFAYTLLGDYDKAIENIEMVLDKDPTDTSLMNSKGLILLLNENYEEAINLFDQVLVILPEDSNALYNKADALIQIGEYSKAIDVLDKLLAKNPQDKDAMTIMLIALMEEEEYSRALEIANKILEIDPQDSDIKDVRDDLEQFDSWD